ncbi:hypothetical protein ACJJTC_010977 [Scirpophaga incertulas]
MSNGRVGQQPVTPRLLAERRFSLQGIRATIEQQSPPRMSSSSASWRPDGDIIDLDRFMRTARPYPRPRSHRRGKRTVSDHAKIENKADNFRSLRTSAVSSSRMSRVRRRYSKNQRDYSIPERECSKTEREFQSRLKSSIHATGHDIQCLSCSSSEIQKDRYRVEECRTYMLIMRRLDDLSRAILARKAVVATPTDSSSGSVSVCDKLVATDALVHNKHKLQDTLVCDIVSTKTETSPNATSAKQEANDNLVKNVETATSARSINTSNVKNSATATSAKYIENVTAARIEIAGSTSKAKITSTPKNNMPSVCAVCQRLLRTLQQYIASKLNTD